MTGTETIQITGVVQEASTHSPSLIGAGAEESGFGRYPFAEPSTADERAWWDEMRRMAREGGETTRPRMAEHLRRWAPLLRLMTPVQRRSFHDDRRTIAATFFNDLDSVRGDSERDDAERALHTKWKLTLTARGTP